MQSPRGADEVKTSRRPRAVAWEIGFGSARAWISIAIPDIKLDYR